MSQGEKSEYEKRPRETLFTSMQILTKYKWKLVRSCRGKSRQAELGSYFHATHVKFSD